MLFSRQLFRFAVLVFLVFASPAGAAETAGVVLLHGKQGSADARLLRPLVAALMREGCLVRTPEMPWSGARIYDRTYEAAMEEIDAVVKELRDSGAKKIFIGGQSLGANAALYYAGRTEVDGVLALSPGHIPDVQTPEDSVTRAKRIIQAGRGDERASFEDNNQGNRFTVQTTAKIYLSYMDPDGPAVMPKSAAALKPGTPLLWVVGMRDPMSKRGRSYAFDKAPRHPLNRYVEIKGDHLSTPGDAVPEILAWLRTVQNP